MSEKLKQFYVYILRDPRPGKEMEPFYVGKGLGKRAKWHAANVAGHYNRFLRNVLGKVFAANLKPVIEIVRYYEDEAEAFRLEVDLIALYGRRDLGAGPLCNLTDGGEGSAGSDRGPEFAERMRQRMLECYANPTLAKAHAERMSKVHADPDFKKAQAERMSRTVRKLFANPEYVEAHAARMRELHTEPEYAKANSDRMHKRNADPVFAKRKSVRSRKTMEKLHADREFAKARDERARAQIIKLNADPEFAKAAAERGRDAMRKLQADPEVQARRIASIRAAAARRRAAKEAAEAAKTGPAGSTPANDNLAKALAA